MEDGSITEEDILREVIFRTSRSGGKGGQNVNKVSSKVELVYNISASYSLSESQKEKLLAKLAHKLDSEGLLHVVSQTSRSQTENKKIAVEKLITLLQNGLKERKKRIPSKPKKSATEKRITSKKKVGETKRLRNSKDLE